MDDLLTIKAAAEYLNLNPMTVRRWLTAKESPKKLPNARRQNVGNVETWLIPLADLEVIKARQAAEPEAPAPRGWSPDYVPRAEAETARAALEAEISALTTRLELAELRASMAEANAQERAARIASLETQLSERAQELRALIATNAELVSRQPKALPAPARRSWWPFGAKD